MKTKKAAGANLEGKRFIFLETGIIIALVLAITAFEWKSKVNDSSIIILSGDKYEEEGTIVNTFRDKIKLPPPPPQYEIVVVENEKIVLEPVEIPSVEIGENTPVDEWIPKVKDEPNEVDPPSIAEIMPKFRGKHHNEFSKFIAQHVRYPKEAEKNGVDGTVYVKFIIDEKGNLVNAKIYKGINKDLDEEVLRVVNLSEKWTPGIQNMKPVKVSFVFPVKFELTKN